MKSESQQLRRQIGETSQLAAEDIFIRSINNTKIQFGSDRSNLELISQASYAANLRAIYAPLEPIITIPSEWTKIDIVKDGIVTINSPGSVATSVGEISLTTFYGEVTDDSISEEDVENRIGPPFECQPGSSGAGHLDQYTASQFCLPITWRIATLTIILGCAGCYILTNGKAKMP